MTDAVAIAERRTLLQSTALAVAAFAAVVISSKISLRSSVISAEPPMLEAELVPAVPQEKPHLYQGPKAAQVVTHEKAVSVKAATSTQAAAPVAQPEVQNQTVSGAPAGEMTHGPQVQSAPPPKLPSYLKDQNLKTSVLIEFKVSDTGVSTPSLIGSSGNEELDALAVRAAQKWVFRPAFKDGKAIESKVRLRMNFEVD